jgi:Uma2 family endonuclease
MVTKAGHWTADDLDLLPDDGNRYEVVEGELFVTPAPARAHQAVADAFHSRLRAYVMAQHIGRAFFAPGDVHFDANTRVQPDLFVEPRSATGRPRSWRDAPWPALVVEILSDSTARRDLGAKRELYERAGIPEYWIVDPEDRTVRVIRAGEPEAVEHARIEWRPTGASDALVIDLSALFREALDE